MAKPRRIPYSKQVRDTRPEHLVLSELLTNIDSQGTVEFSGHRGRIEENRPEIQEFLIKRRFGRVAISPERPETEQTSLEDES